MKTTLDLPEELIREVKLRAVLQRRPMKDLVAELLRQGLGLEPAASETIAKDSGRVSVDALGLPVIRCATDAPATKLNRELLLALEQDAMLAEDHLRAGLPFWHERLDRRGVSHPPVPHPGT